jgi:hypothetical protein
VIGGIQTIVVVVVVVGRGYTYCGRVYHPVGGIRGGGAPFRDHIKPRIWEGISGSCHTLIRVNTV